MTAKLTWARVLLYATLIVVAAIYLMPIYMTVITALKDPADINLDTAWQLPSHLNWGSFSQAYAKLGPNIVNSIILAVTATLLSSLLGSLNGYVFSKWSFRGNDLVFTLLLFGMFIPYQIILIPLFQTLRAMHLYGGLPGLILAHVVYGLPITTLIFRNFYAQIPSSLTESAQIDGAGFFKLYLRVIFPLSIPGLKGSAHPFQRTVHTFQQPGETLGQQLQPATLVSLKHVQDREAQKKESGDNVPRLHLRHHERDDSGLFRHRPLLQRSLKGRSFASTKPDPRAPGGPSKERFQSEALRYGPWGPPFDRHPPMNSRRLRGFVEDPRMHRSGEKTGRRRSGCFNRPPRFIIEQGTFFAREKERRGGHGKRA